VNFVFGPFELDARGFKLRRDGAEVALQPKVFDAIRYLVEHHDRVVPKEELLEALWPGEHVNDTAVPWTISRARKALGQGPEAKDPIETVRGRGYRFTAQVGQHASSSPGPASSKILKTSPERASSPTFVTLATLAATSSSDPFVGRAEPMERLLGALHGARGGRGRLCLLTGDAGMGKTRCVSEFAIVARRSRLSVSSGRCLEGGRTAAFWPWVQVLRDTLAEEDVPADVKIEVQGLLAELVPRPDTLDRRLENDDASGLGARFWVLEKLSRHLLRAGEKTPRVILLEDVHWADEASLDLLAFLAAELAHVSVLVVATARDTLPAGSEAWAKVLSRLGPCERIELAALNPKDVEAYVAEVTGLDLPADIHSTVYVKSAGNPLFLQESVRLLAASCSVRGVEGLRTDDIKVPGVARDVLRARLTGLSADTCEALEVACVIGQEFELPVLQGALAGATSAESLLAGLDEARRARLLAPRARAGTFAFVHETIREALYEGLPTARRADLHRRVAEAIESRLVGDLRANDLAYHYYRGLPCAEPARVERHTRRAGEAAMGRYAYEEAAQFFAWALEAQRFQDGAAPRACCELLLGLGGALRMSGRIVDARKGIGRAIDIARANRFADLLWEAARLLRPNVRSALVPDALSLQALEDASKMLSDDQSSLRIRVLAQLACIPPYALSTERSHELSARAVELARSRGDAADLAQALISRLHVLSGPDYIEEALAVIAEILRLDPEREVDIAATRYCALLQAGDMLRGESALESLGRVSRARRRPESVWHYDRMRAMIAYHAGEFEEADAQFHELFVQARRMRLPYGDMHAVMHACAMAYERTGLQGLASSGFVAQLDWASAIPSFRAHWVRFLVEIGRTDDARETFEAIAADDFAGVTKEIGYLNALAHLSAVAVALGDRPRAETLYALLLPYPHHNTPNGFQYCLGSVSYFLGSLARLLGRPREAAGHLEDALAMNQRIGFVPQAARTQVALAELLAESSRLPDRARAGALLGEAGATAQRLDMASLAAQVERALQRLGEPVAGRPPARARG
jgi:DNA-binding winged helix-turn-helix (wHTH) protein/tetratricopeptide (TPR) repeat protein